MSCLVAPRQSEPQTQPTTDRERLCSHLSFRRPSLLAVAVLLLRRSQHLILGLQRKEGGRFAFGFLGPAKRSVGLSKAKSDRSAVRCQSLGNFQMVCAFLESVGFEQCPAQSELRSRVSGIESDSTLSQRRGFSSIEIVDLNESQFDHRRNVLRGQLQLLLVLFCGFRPFLLKTEQRASKIVDVRLPAIVNQQLVGVFLFAVVLMDC